ncbi:hypothetical protein L6452_02864 [Arctium lappa]|uniref:Uncharacterized protein n=1 Tax=Arctium lappa TaxID=4217 RepID=A0ACB9FKS7_ARCLA|nr:hypothetical protein L6452_02864 [Arctium lappa]
MVVDFYSQDMACDTFLKIVQKCKRKFVMVQVGENEPFVSELLTTLPTTIIDLEIVAQTVVLFKELRLTLHSILNELIRKPQLVPIGNSVLQVFSDYTTALLESSLELETKNISQERLVYLSGQSNYTTALTEVLTKKRFVDKTTDDYGGLTKELGLLDEMKKMILSQITVKFDFTSAQGLSESGCTTKRFSIGYCFYMLFYYNPVQGMGSLLFVDY